MGAEIIKMGLPAHCGLVANKAAADGWKIMEAVAAARTWSVSGLGGPRRAARADGCACSVEVSSGARRRRDSEQQQDG